MKKLTVLSFTSACVLLLSACNKETFDSEADASPAAPPPVTSLAPTKTLASPLLERKCYQLFSGYNSSSPFEASGIYALNGSFYLVFDNLYKIGKVSNTLPTPGNNTLTGASGSNSQYEGITFDNNGTPNWYVVTESSQKTSSTYNPKINQFNTGLSLQYSSWVDYPLSKANSNKGFEGIAWVRAGNDDYLMALVENSNKILALKQSGSNWIKQYDYTLPINFSDYSDITIYGSKIAVTSQEQSLVWVANISFTATSISTDAGVIYKFPTGNSSGQIGAGGYNIYANVEGVSFIDATTIVTCTDRADDNDPPYKKTKDQSVQVFKLN